MFTGRVLHPWLIRRSDSEIVYPRDGFALFRDVWPAGDEIIRANKREDDVKESRSRIPSHATSTIAEEAVDQLQASEKLIAGESGAKV